MLHHPIFDGFPRAKCVGTGRHVFDFLGVATDVLYKRDWHGHALKRGWQCEPDYPEVNEHYFDWIALLESVCIASGTFRMAELGAGWAPWLVRAVFAARHNRQIGDLELVGVEADATHYDWMRDHFLDNDLNPNEFELLRGAVAPSATMIRFPRIDNPDENYGASIYSQNKNSDYLEVPGYSLLDLLDKFSGPVDLLHLDIQGAEYDVIPPALIPLKEKTKAIMVNTHLSQERHFGLQKLFEENGWEPLMVYPRNEEIATPFGIVRFGDGFLNYRNPLFK